GLEERNGQPRRGRGVGERAIQRRDLLLSGELVLERVEPRLELGDLAAVLQQIGDDGLAPRDLALQRAQLRAQLRDLRLGRRQQEEIPGGGEDERAEEAE